MRIPKRFELHLAAGDGRDPAMDYDAIRVVGGRLCATDGVIVASVPVDPASGVRLEPGEELLEGARVEPKAWAEATRGSTGAGTLRLQFGSQVACSAEGKPQMHFPAPGAAKGEVPPIGEALAETRREYEDLNCLALEVIIDAEALHRLARAIGAGSGVRLLVPVTCCEDDPLPELIETTGLLVRAVDGDGEGILMPIKREGRDDE